MTLKTEITTQKDKEMLQDHENRIRRLEIADVKLFEQMKSVCEKVGGLTKVLWWLATTVAGAILLFIIGYVLQMLEVL